MYILNRYWSLALHLFVIFSQILVVEYIIGYLVWYISATGFRDRAGTPLGADFLNVYAAGILVNRGQSASVYNWAIHSQIEHTVVGYAAPYFGWHYPPLFLFVASALALFPYLLALYVYLVLSAAIYGAVLYKILPRDRQFLWGAVAFSGNFINIVNGQNGFITASLFGAGFLFLEKEPWLGGMFLGLLSYKPQFFVVVPLILAIGGYKKALASSLATACVSMALSYLVYGKETWSAFISSTATTRQIVLEQGSTGWQKIQSIFSFARAIGLNIETCYILQGIFAVLAIGITALIWRNERATLAVKASALCGCALFVTPYVLDYDLILLAIPVAFLSAEGVKNGFLRYEKLSLIGIWLLPFLVRSLSIYHIPLTPCALTLLLAICVDHVGLKRLLTFRPASISKF